MLSAEPGATATLADRMAALRASAAGAGGDIAVTVSSSGNVTGLELDDRALSLGGEELAMEILRTIRRAQDRLAEQVEAVVADTVGVGTETGKAVLDGFTQRFRAEVDEPVMPSPPPFPSFRTTPSLPHQQPGNGFESGRDSRAR